MAIYARVSTEEQAEHGYSIDAQLETLQDYSRKNGRVVVEEYVDRGISGKSTKGRHQLQRLMTDAEAGKFSEVLVWKINRMARNTIDLLRIVETLGKFNVSFRSFSENFETETPMGRFALQMMAAVGELERNTIVDNVKMGMKQAARMGNWNGGQVLGYKSSEKKIGQKTEGQLTIVPEEAALVLKIFELYSVGHGLRSIANRINREGHRTKKGNSFSTDSVKAIITNPLYIGKIRYNKYENWSERRRKGLSKEPILVGGHHEPIVSESLWNRVCALQKQKAKKNPRTFDGQFILTGLMRCPECGATMVASRTKDKLKDGTAIVRRYYSCGAFRSKGSSVCHANSIKADYAESYVLDRIKQVANKPFMLRDVLAAVNRRKGSREKPLKDELKTLTTSVANIDKTKHKYIELYEMEAINRKDFVSRMDELNRQAEQFDVRREELEAEISSLTPSAMSLPQIQGLMRQLDSVLAKAPFEQRKLLLHSVIRRIEVTATRRVTRLDIVFDQSTQQMLSRESPSDDESEGDSTVWLRNVALTI